MNKVTDYNKELGYIEINGKRFCLSCKVVNYRGANLETPVKMWSVKVANDWNQSNLFLIQSAQIRGLISKIEKHPYRLVK